MANYAIMRIEKRKLGSVGRIGNHHERLKAEYKSNPDIDPSRTHQNYHIVEPPSKYRKAVLDRIESVGAKRRKDSVVMQDCFVGGTPDWLKGKTVEEQREYFDYAYRFFEDSFGKENIISAVVHLPPFTGSSRQRGNLRLSENFFFAHEIFQAGNGFQCLRAVVKCCHRRIPFRPKA